MEERGHHCVILRKADAAAVNVLGFKVYAEADLDAAYARRPGLPVAGLSARSWAAPYAPLIRMAFRWNFTPRWTVWRRFIRNTLYHGVKPLRDRPFQLLLA